MVQNLLKLASSFCWRVRAQEGESSHVHRKVIRRPPELVRRCHANTADRIVGAAFVDRERRTRTRQPHGLHERVVRKRLHEAAVQVVHLLRGAAHREGNRRDRGGMAAEAVGDGRSGGGLRRRRQAGGGLAG